MGNNQAKYLNDPNIKLLKNHFSPLELYMLGLIFKDLSARQHGVIDKETFLQFFPLTGLWGERLFDKFDVKHTGYINFFEFVKGIAKCCNSTEDEKIHFLFSLYDMDQDGFIKKKEMVTMLYNYPKTHIKFITDDIAPDNGEKLAKMTEKRIKSIQSIEDNYPGSQNFLDSPSRKEKGGTLQSVHSDNLDGVLNDELEVASEEKIHTNFYFVERDINQPYQVQLEREKELKLSVQQTNPEHARTKQKKKTQSISIDMKQSLASPDKADASERGMSVDKIAPTRNSREVLVCGDNSKLTAGRRPSGSRVIMDQSFVISTTVNSRVKEYASFMFKTFEGANSRGKISYEEFKQWLNMHPIILKVFDETFHQEIWANPNGENGSKFFTGEEDQQVKDAVKRSVSEGHKSESSTSLRYREKPCDMEGIMFKKGKKSKSWTKRYFELRDHFLFYYEKKEDKKPKGILFLDGCFIEELKDFNQTQKYGFSITHKSESYVPRVFYCNTKEEFDQWMKNLQVFKSSTVMDLYTFHEKIGTGKFSVVYRATSKADKNAEYAVKVIEKKLLRPEEKEFLLSETSVMKVLDHPNMIKLIDTVETKSNIYIITEIVKDGDLFDYITTREFLEEYDASFIMKQLLISIYYLHSIGIIHRDIKPENILITLGNNSEVKELKIIDFGFAKLVNDTRKLSETCGTPNYVAPEVLRGCGYDKTADVFSLGVIMFLMIRGLLPFDAHDVNVILKNTLRCDMLMEDDHWSNISPEGKDLLSKFLQKDPSQRIDIADALRHPWIKNREELKKYIGLNRNKDNSMTDANVAGL